MTATPENPRQCSHPRCTHDISHWPDDETRCPWHPLTEVPEAALSMLMDRRDALIKLSHTMKRRRDRRRQAQRAMGMNDAIVTLIAHNRGES